jgi:exonuclease SbcC
MIPTLVSLKNFLTFAGDTNGAPIVFEFDGATLWSIAGVNGAGKSAIFDAITYALYGEHRGGRQQDNRLIRKGATTAEVVFEFLQGGQRYRVERSVTRKVGRKGQARPDAKHVQASAWVDSDRAWVAIPDTDKPTELERWVRTLLGMGPETFSSSVLLRQGEADKLLNAKANQRFRILAGLIDLRAYQRLEQLAVERRKAADTNVEILDQQLAEVDDVTDEQLAHAASEVATAELAIATADEQRLEADRRWHGAQRHAELRERHRTQNARRAELDGMVRKAESIRAAARERRHLDTIVEPVATALTDLEGADSAEQAAREAATLRDAIDLTELEAIATETAGAQRQFDDDLETLNDRSQQLAAVLSDGKDILRCRREHAQRAERLTTLGDPAELRSQTDQSEAELKAARDGLGELETRRNEAIDRRGAAQSTYQASEDRLALLDDLSREPTCSRCNQPVTAEHLDRERLDACAVLEQARTALAAEQQAVTELGEAISKQRATVEDWDRRHRAAVGAADAARTAHEELKRAQAGVEAAVTAATPTDIDEAAVALLARVVHESLEDAEKGLGALDDLEKSTGSAITQTKKSRDDARKMAQAAQKALDAARHKRGELDRALSVQEERTRHLRDRAELRLRDVPADIAAAVRAGDERILSQLEERLETLVGALEELDRLEIAEQELATVLATLATIESDLTVIPLEHQIPVAEARSSLDGAEQAFKEARARRDATRDEHKRLDQAHTARRQLAKKLAAARQQSRIAKRLATLLGKSELQGRLLTDATTGVEAYANDTLARISGGTLELELRRHDAGDGALLDIFVKDSSSADEVLEVAFISGSQKFRVAVAVAAGLGQYLGGDAAVRSLIIDEGFGSLDADGRQRMIEELRALAEHLDRIIVVSHQEDFMDRTLFPTGFVLRKEGTETVVERVG